uniref:Rhomboid domain-containing protein n=1 Tax=Heterorhabditis bacteriophora TaxID=37862 RepID=A0A1I7XKC0_HETBA
MAKNCMYYIGAVRLQLYLVKFVAIDHMEGTTAYGHAMGAVAFSKGVSGEILSILVYNLMRFSRPGQLCDRQDA